MYSVIWKYKIKPDCREAFENEYGSDGSWFKLFSESADYKGSFLHKSDDDADSYILTDTWITQESYEIFKKNNESVYNELSSRFECLYDSEEKIGAFES